VATAGKPRDRIRSDKLVLTVRLHSQTLREGLLQHPVAYPPTAASPDDPLLPLPAKSCDYMLPVYIGMQHISP